MFDISVVIVNFNTKDEVDRCLDSLYLDIRQSSLNVKIVIVDNASSDGSMEYLAAKHPGVERIMLGENRGFGAAQNIGLSAFSSKYFFVLNPDTYFFHDGKVLREMFDFMEKNNDIGILGPKIIYPDGALQLSCYRFPTVWHPLFTRAIIHTERGRRYHRHLTMKDVEHNEIMPVDWVMGSAMFIRGSSLDRVGKFDERFWMYYEDSDLCRRFWEAGIPVFYFPKVKMEHAHRRGSASESKILKAILKNKLARVHLVSWLKYMWKWRGNYKYYAVKV